MKRLLAILLTVFCVTTPVKAKTIRWVDFKVPYESLKYAMDVDVTTSEKEHHLSWIGILALAGYNTGGNCPVSSVKNAVQQLERGWSPEKLSDSQRKLYGYYYDAYTAVLGGLLGNYAIEVDGELKPTYGLKAYSPIADGYHYCHCADFGNQRSFGFARKHLGNDLMGSLGTPIVAVESGIVEAMGWNRYGGWRIGIRSTDSKRYYYYAHLMKDHPFASELREGDLVQAGDLIGYMGRTGYSDRENVNNIETVHLHFGIQLVFEESQKECNSEIWIDAYPIVRLLQAHRSTIIKQDGIWRRKMGFVDLDILQYPDSEYFVEN